jgi:putative oxidoreductase
MHSTTSNITSTTAHVAKDYLPTLARLLMCSLFIWDGVLQLRDSAGMVTYFTSLNVPSPQIAVWVSIAVHLLGGIGILVGFMTRWAAAFDLAVPRHRVRRASARRRLGEHDAFL